jgi:hypothetical protein
MERYRRLAVSQLSLLVQTARLTLLVPWNILSVLSRWEDRMRGYGDAQ